MFSTRRTSLDIDKEKIMDTATCAENRINKHIRRMESRRKGFRSFSFNSTELTFTIVLCSVILLMIIGLTSAQGLSQFPSFQTGNGHLIRRFAQGPDSGGFAVLMSDTQPQIANIGNNHKPNFTDCAFYQPEIYEEQGPDAFVLRVKAIDLDPLDIGGRVNYSIIYPTESFKVDPDTGIVRTLQSFDRDEPAKQREVYLTVKAADNGHPKLETICTIKVKILDINDNRPMFDKYNYIETVQEDLEVGKVVTRVSASDIDDGSNGTVVYGLLYSPFSPNDINYFNIVPQTGEVTLRQKLDDRNEKPEYYLEVTATDRGRPSLGSKTNLTIIVLESNKKPPSIKDHVRHFELPEYSVDKSKPILELTADSNTPEGIVFWELLKGPTESSNKDNHFILDQEGNKAILKVEKDLDYESVTKYTLNIQATNKHKLSTTTLVSITVTDENDEKPNFIEVGSGSVLERELPGSYVMKVKALDKDGTSPNNEVKYFLREEDKANFRIDENTGEIWTVKEFDREAQELYQVYVIAKDGAPSVITRNGLPNNRTIPLKIEIIDKNDNKPIFDKAWDQAYVEEDANLKQKVIEVRARDPDTASILTYSIVAGDPDNDFLISTTSASGIISVAKPLDFETKPEYTLTVKVSDSIYEAFTKVVIKVTDVNDNPPEFLPGSRNITILEETIPRGCIFTVQAYDPDIPDRKQKQDIVYFFNKGDDHFQINSEGCIEVIKQLDRDLPDGAPIAQIIVGAHDEGGITPTKKTSYLDLTVILIDVNDNAPFLNSSNPVVWDENQPTGGVITELTADDHDEARNGPPFNFYIDPKADNEIKSLFSITGTKLNAIRANFDREEKKQYLVPVIITDGGSPQQTGTSMLTVIIGDENDNDMFSGESKIFVYKYKETAPVTIGRVYVEDKDDWDLPDKNFTWIHKDSNFDLDESNGNIDVLPSAPPGNYRLSFIVEDTKRKQRVEAYVDVVIKQITDEAVDNSGSIRFYGITQEDFIKRGPGPNGRSKQDILRTEISRILGVPEENVDVFTVLNSPHNSDPLVLDVRYSAHNSPYYKPERLDGTLSGHKLDLERALGPGVKIMLIKIDECLQEKFRCETSCTNHLHKSDAAYKIYTNTTSFVGVRAFVDPICECAVNMAPKSCDVNPCLYGGICQEGVGIDGYRCECEAGFSGKRCEVSSIHLDGETWAWFPPLSVCSDSVLDVNFKTGKPDGLIMYNGPTYTPSINVTDFMSLELREGKPILLMDFGSGVRELRLASDNLADGEDHLISITWTQKEISISVDGCVDKNPKCFQFGGPIGSHEFLNVNGPLQLGGLSFDIKKLKSSMPWSASPTATNFAGCITNLSLNGQFYNLRQPSHSSGNVTTCDATYAAIGPGPIFLATPLFIIIIVLCFLILIILILSVVFYKRRRDYEALKLGPADEVQGNVVHYHVDGGGEQDAPYNLALLSQPYPMSPYVNKLDPVGRSVYNPNEPDLGTFVQDNKDRMDRDPDGLPFDDVRNYAYEGDGNSMGSLSSLASGTDDSDLNFDFLPSFGPRFKKLADMYGGNSSDDNSSIYSGR